MIATLQWRSSIIAASAAVSHQPPYWPGPTHQLTNIWLTGRMSTAMPPLMISMAWVSAVVTVASRSRVAEPRSSLSAGCAACISNCGWFANTVTSFPVQV